MFDKEPALAWIGRAPYGARGLKRERPYVLRIRLLPRPVRGAWVETHPVDGGYRLPNAAPRTGRVG